MERIEEIIPFARKNRQIYIICTKFSDLHTGTITPQKSDLSIGDARALFSTVSKIYPFFKDHLCPSTRVFSETGRGALLLQDFCISSISEEGPLCIEGLKVNTKTSITEDNVNNDNTLSISDRDMKRWSLSIYCERELFLKMCFIFPTTNICELIFSQTGCALDEHRRTVIPSKFDTQMFLHANYECWNVNDVQNIM